MPLYALDDVTPRIPDECWIAPDAHVIGDVRFAAGVSVWFGAVLRGDNEPIEVGRDSNIQEGALFHVDPGFPLTVGAECTIGHHAILHGCSVGDGSLIGMGATVLNGARIGAGCLVGAGALVTEGKEFPDGVLIVGAPARVLRPLDLAHQARIRETAAGYGRRWRQFAKGLRRLD